MNLGKKLIRITTVPISLQVLLKNQLRFMNAHFEVVAVSSPGKELAEVKKQEGVRIAAINMTRAITPVKDALSLLRLYRFFKKEKPAIVHTHTPKAGLLGMIAAKWARVPVRLHTVAGLPLMEKEGITRKILEYTERTTFSCATKVYPNSAVLCNFILKENFCAKTKLKVLGNGSSNGIDTDFFSLTDDVKKEADKLKTSLKIAENDFIFVFIGRLVKDKGIEELVTAFIKIKQQYANIKLLLVGSYEPHLDPLSQQTTDTINKDAAIIYEDFKQDIRPYLAISNALAFPSYREGFPNAPMQAGCFNLPCIVTDINGCNEIIEHEKNGLIIPLKNVLALEEAMITMLTDKMLYNNMKLNARPMITARYDQQVLWNLLLKEYELQLQHHVS